MDKPLGGTLLFSLLAIALTSCDPYALSCYNPFTSCNTTGKQSEARQFVGAMNRAQQAYYLEFNQFSPTVPALQLGIETQTANYQYSTRATPRAAFNFGKSIREEAQPWLQPPKKWRSYVGGVFLVPNLPAKQSEPFTTIAILCESEQAGVNVPLPEPQLKNGEPVCAAGTTSLR